MEIKVNWSGDAKRDKNAVDYALRDFKKLVKKSGIMNELRRRESYMSPSAYKKWRKNEAIKRQKREERKQQWSDEQAEW